MNFAWIIFIFALIAATKIQLKKFDLNFIPIIISYIFFIAVSCLFLTYVHYRYNQLGLFFYTLILGVLICNNISQYVIRKLCLSVIAILFLIQCYIDIDPVSNLLPFTKVNIGKEEMVSTRKYFYGGAPYYDYAYIEGDKRLMSQHLLAEGFEYNRQWINFQKVMEQAITNLKYDSSKLIILKNFGGWIENTNGQVFGVMDETGYYWDNNKNTVTRDNTGIPLNLTIGEWDFANENYNEIYYIDFPFNEFHTDNFFDKYSVMYQYKESVGPWVIGVYRIK